MSHTKRLRRAEKERRVSPWFQGAWAADLKHGEGTFFYEEAATRYDGVWEAGA
jgi:hypothetical protein